MFENKQINQAELENVSGGVRGNILFYFRIKNVRKNEFSSWYGPYASEKDCREVYRNMRVTSTGVFEIEIRSYGSQTTL